MGRVVLAHGELVANDRIRVTAFVLVALCFGLLAGGLAISHPQQRSPRFPTAPLVQPMGSCTSGVMCLDDTPAAPSEKPKEILPEALTILEPVTSPTTTLFFAGDMMFDRTVAVRIQSSKNLAYPFAHIVNDPRYAAALHVGNLEGPITATRREPVKSLDFAFDPAMAQVLSDAGFQALSQANNHQLDQGREGANQSRTALQSAKIAAFGDQVKDDPISAMTIVDVRGTRVALLGFNTTDNPLDKDEAENALTEARTKADLVIVMPHWGMEYEATPQPTVKELAHWYVDHGADLVIGSHPHWVQTVEIYKNHPIVYSLGNFIFDQDWSRETNEGLAVTLQLGKTSRVLTFHPIRIERSQPRFLDGEDRRIRLEHLAEISDPSLQEALLSGHLILQNP